MRRKLKKKVQARITRWLYDTCLLNRREQEKLGRLQFFHNAFKALSFNGIDGDYAEFGCCGGNTFAHAYRESRYHGHAAKLWAFDSFQGLPPATDDKDLHPEWVEGTMAITACSTSCRFWQRLIDQPTTIPEYRSTTTHRYNHWPPTIRTYVISVTHRVFGLSALKSRAR